MRTGTDINYDPDQKIWRYIKLNRFLDMIKDNMVHFASANQFDDLFEGAVAVQAYDFPVDPRYSEMDYTERAFFALKRLTKINCWHIEDYESAAMWQLYSDQGKGVAIVSTPRKIDNFLTSYKIKPEYKDENLWGGNVNYVNLLEEHLDVGMLERFYFKHNAFSWEKEFRCVVSLRYAEESGCQIPEFGIFLKANLLELIERIHIGPSIQPEQREKIFKECEKFELDDRIIVSSLLGRPKFV
ncbi:DUF2971 domain-containing protein [candidate division KSB1 bacterium]|nr:DUF2971 domain-containing protein [candidate division KSB1 bacterium]